MAFTAISTKDVCIQEGGVGGYNMIASGTILAGQAVEIVTYPYVIATDSNPALDFIGVAGESASSGEPVAVYGPGSIVYSRVSGASVAAGDELQATKDGEFADLAAAASGLVGIALETQATADGLCRILLFK